METVWISDTMQLNGCTSFCIFNHLTTQILEILSWRVRIHTYMFVCELDWTRGTDTCLSVAAGISDTHTQMQNTEQNRDVEQISCLQTCCLPSPSCRVLMASLESRESRENLDRRAMLEPLDPKDPLVPLDLQWVSLDMFFFLIDTD